MNKEKTSLTNTDYENRLGTYPLLPLILKMSIPSIAAQLVNMLYSIVDKIYIGHIPNIGTNALAGIGVTSSVIIFISAFACIVVGGGAPLAAIALGKGDRKRASKILGNGLTLLIIFSVAAMAVAYSFMRPILMAVGASDVTVVYATDYLKIYLVGTFFVMTATGLNAFINIQGRPMTAMISVIIGAVLNIILDPIFIFVFDMGVKGAAYATVISQAVSSAWILAFLLSHRASLKIERQYLRPERKTIASIFSLGISPFVMAVTESLVGFVLNNSLKDYGDIYVSALTVMQSGMMLVSVPLSGFTQGCNPVLSYNYGQGNKERVKRGFYISLCIMASFNLIVVVLMMIFPSVVASIFTNDKELIGVVSKILPVFIAGMTIFGLQRACQNTFLALDQAKISLFIALLRKVILLIPLALVLPHFMGVMGVYTAEAVADATAAIICTILFAVKFPKILAGCKANEK